MKNKPVHEHDCSRCVYIGQLNNVDLYYCKGDDATSYIARNSGLGSDYASLEDFGDKLYKEDVRSHGYGSGFTDEFIERDRRRRTLLRVLTGAIADLMDRERLCD